jgi:hypothetical protein
LPNWLLTDYLDFRWFVGGEKRLTVRVAELDAKRKVKELPEGEQKLGALLTAFYGQPALTVASAKDLAERMLQGTSRRKYTDSRPGHGCGHVPLLRD